MNLEFIIGPNLHMGNLTPADAQSSRALLVQELPSQRTSRKQTVENQHAAKPTVGDGDYSTSITAASPGSQNRHRSISIDLMAISDISFQRLTLTSPWIN